MNQKGRQRERASERMGGGERVRGRKRATASETEMQGV